MNFVERLNAALNVNEPVIYVDVGAMGGIPAYWQQLGACSKAIAFEPDEREFSKLKSNPQCLYLPYALAETSKDITFHIAKDGGKSSVYKPNMRALSDFPDAERYKTIKTIEFPKEKVKAMDQALAMHHVKGVDFIKLDTQGSELGILKGALSTLPDVFGAEIEVEFCELYEGQPLFADVDIFMRSHGFELIDLRRAYWKKASWGAYIGHGQLTFGDALYLRRPEEFLNHLSVLEASAQKSKIARAIAVCMVYRLADYASDLLLRATTLGVIPKDESQVAMTLLRQEASGWGINFPGRSILSKIFNRLAEVFRPTSYLGFSDGDRFIGNSRNI